MQMHLDICMHVCVCVCVCSRPRAHTHKHAYTHKPTHTQMPAITPPPLKHTQSMKGTRWEHMACTIEHRVSGIGSRGRHTLGVGHRQQRQRHTHMAHGGCGRKMWATDETT